MIKLILFIFFIIVVYLVIINIVFYFTSFPTQKTNTQNSLINMGFSADVTTRLNKWYGERIGVNGNYKLYLFSFIPLPLKTQTLNFFWVNVIFIAIFISIVIYFIFIKILFSNKF